MKKKTYTSFLHLTLSQVIENKKKTWTLLSVICVGMKIPILVLICCNLSMVKATIQNKCFIETCTQTLFLESQQCGSLKIRQKIALII